jgi:uncharacterized Zn-binding protein involved in type VI secretion
MATGHMTSKDAQFVLLSNTPDVCLTPIGKDKLPLPYALIHKMGTTKQASSNVYMNGNPAFLHGKSFVAGVKGDAPGTGGGIRSDVNKDVSYSDTHSSSVFINGQPMVRTGDKIKMNIKAP